MDLEIFFSQKQQSSLMEIKKNWKKNMQENIDVFQKIVWHHH
jgi:hypothetical protein